MIVRKMLPQEMDSTMICAGYYFDEAAQALPAMSEQYDENSVRETIRQYASQYQYTWLNAMESGRCVGFVAGFLSTAPWNNRIITANIALMYLLESHRSMENFRELVTKFEEWARTAGATDMTAGDIGINPERTQRLYQHLGFKPGVWMGKELAYE
jgi:GNAT superfamily N-acetyltransferase